MQGIGSVTNKTALALGIIMLTITSCSQSAPDVPVRVLQIQQNWELQVGDTVAGYKIAGSLGDVSVELNGGVVYAPFDGQLQPNDIAGCYVYSSPEVPAYLFRLCGLQALRLGNVRGGEAIAKGEFLQFAALRRQPDGTWVIVEPAPDILERALKP